MSVAIKRGFSPSIINQAVKKFTKPSSNSTLFDDVKIKPDNSVILPFYPPLCFKLAKILKLFTFKVISKVEFFFSSTKSPITNFLKCGIIKVPWKDCNLFYIG